MGKTREDVKALLGRIGFVFKEQYIGGKNDVIEVYEMGIKIFRFQTDISMLNDDAANEFIFHIENDYSLTYQTLSKIFISDVRKRKIKLLLNG